MRSIALSLAVLVGLGLASAPAFADCATDLKKAREIVAKVTDTKKKEMATKELGVAETALKAKNEKDCTASVLNANAAIK